MQNKHNRDNVSLSSEDAAKKIGNLFDTVLILSQRIRELKSGHAALVNQGDTSLSKAMHEIAAGKVTKAWLKHESPDYNPKRRTAT